MGESMLTAARQATGPAQCALVTYVPGRLGTCLDELRNTLLPWTPPGRPHVTVLPPRPFQHEARLILEDWRRRSQRLDSFDIEATRIEVFDNTRVIYLAIGAGRAELMRMHGALDDDGDGCTEAFPFHPHVTLAQGVEPRLIEEVSDKARRFWDAYAGPRTFRAEQFVLVHGSPDGKWRDVGNLLLDGYRSQ